MDTVLWVGGAVMGTSVSYGWKYLYQEGRITGNNEEKQSMRLDFGACVWGREVFQSKSLPYRWMKD